MTGALTTPGVYVIPRPEMVIVDEYAMALIDELKAFPTAWVYVLTKALSRPTPKEYIQDREGPSHLKLFYVDGAYAIATRAALSRIGIASDFEVLDTVVEGEESVSALCKLTFKFFCAGQLMTATSSQWGDCSKRSGMAWGDVRKGAVTDGLKKCMSEFGWASDVYGMAPEKMPVGPTPEEARDQSIGYVRTAMADKGVSSKDLQAYLDNHYGGQKLEQLDQVALTSVRRKIQSPGGLK